MNRQWLLVGLSLSAAFIGRQPNAFASTLVDEADCIEQGGRVHRSAWHEVAGKPICETGFPLKCPSGEHKLGSIGICVFCCVPDYQEITIKSARPIILIREGRKSVFGVELELSKDLPQSVDPKDISIIESKRSRELRSLMNVSYGRGREAGSARALRVVFKPKKGDFGSGNTVQVTVKAGTALFNGAKVAKDVSVSVRTDLP